MLAAEECGLPSLDSERDETKQKEAHDALRDLMRHNPKWNLRETVWQRRKRKACNAVATYWATACCLLLLLLIIVAGVSRASAGT